MTVDMRGTELAVGDEIAWGGRSGNTGKLSHGTIVEIGQSPSMYREGKMNDWIKARRHANNRWETEGKMVKLTEMDRLVKIPKLEQ